MKLSDKLKNRAQSLLNEDSEFVAIQMLKSAGMKEDEARLEVAQKMMEKEAASHLVAAGIDYDIALNMIKVADIKVKDLKEFKPEPSFEEVLGMELMKVANEVEELESKAIHAEDLFQKSAKLEEELIEVRNSTHETTEVPEAITKFAKSGEFTNEDLQALMALPSGTLTKVAAHNDAPWKMGKSAGVAENAVDPFTAFLMG